MGCAYSHTNLGRDCTYFSAGPKGTNARWGDSLAVSMGSWKEDDDRTEVWGVDYKTAGHEKYSCGFQLEARASQDKDGVESIHFGLTDGDYSTDNNTSFSLDITRVGCDGLVGGIKGISSSSGVAPLSITKAKENYAIEITIVSYGCSLREGLFVLQKRKKKVNSLYAYMVTLAHCYVSKDVGLSAVATICRNKNSSGIGVEVEGPFKHPSADLRKVIVRTCRTGVWSPSACPHCNGAKASTGTKIGVSSNSLDQPNHQQGEDEEAIRQVVKQAIFSSNIREQYNKGLINSNGHTTGSLNHSIMIFKNCNF